MTDISFEHLIFRAVQPSNDKATGSCWPSLFVFLGVKKKMGVKAIFYHFVCFFHWQKLCFTPFFFMIFHGHGFFSCPCFLILVTGKKVGFHGQNSRNSHFYQSIHENGTTLGGLMQTNLIFKNIFTGIFWFSRV